MVIIIINHIMESLYGKAMVIIWLVLRLQFIGHKSALGGLWYNGNTKIVSQKRIQNSGQVD
jgi:hypothetical protein